MSAIIVIIQIVFITLGMIVLGMVLNHFLGLTKEVLQDMRKKALNFRERMKNAQLIGDYEQLIQTQQESTVFMKSIMKKQMIPLCLVPLYFPQAHSQSRSGPKIRSQNRPSFSGRYVR